MAQDHVHGVEDIIVFAHHIAHRIGIDKKLAELVVVERLAVEFRVIDGGCEVVHLRVLLFVHEDELRLMRLSISAQPAVESNIHGPLTEVSLGDASPYHALELYGQLKSDIV